MACRWAFRSSAALAATTPRSRRLCSSNGRSRRKWGFKHPSPQALEDEWSLRRGLRERGRIVVENGREPSLGLGKRLILTPCVIFDLIAFDLADAEIVTLRMAEIEAADRGARPHRKALGQFHPDGTLAAKECEYRTLLGVIRLCRIARRRTDAAIALGDQLLIAQRLANVITPEFTAHPLMHALCERFGKAIGKRFRHDRGIVVVGVLEALDHGIFADAGGDGEGADIIGQPAGAGRDKVRKRQIGSALAPGKLLAQRMQRRDRSLPRLVGEDENVVALAVRGPEADHGAHCE